MSPMNPGQPPFADPMFKMGDSPMGTGTGAVGASAEMPGALSPFSSMFGQMPDMQVNLDWVRIFFFRDPDLNANMLTLGCLGHIHPEPNPRHNKSVLAYDGCTAPGNPTVWRHVTAFSV